MFYIEFPKKRFAQIQDEEQKELKLQFNLAGTPKKDIKIEFDNDQIDVLVKGLPVRAYTVLESLWDVDKGTANYVDGMLTVIFPKAPPKKVKIELK